jgi:hypothetical protein
MIRLRAALLVLPALIFGWSRAASADLFLEFDQANYTISGINGAAAVQVLVTQNSNGPQVGNELLSGAVSLSFPTTGAAVVLSDLDFTTGPAWDAGLATIATSGGNTVFNVTVLSIFGIPDLSSPLLLGTVTFTGRFLGATTTNVSQFDPTTPDFITAMGGVIDPTNAASARIDVVAVPEPASLTLFAAAALTYGAHRLGRRRALAGKR